MACNYRQECRWPLDRDNVNAGSWRSAIQPSPRRSSQQEVILDIARLAENEPMLGLRLMAAGSK